MNTGIEKENKMNTGIEIDTEREISNKELNNLIRDIKEILYLPKFQDIIDIYTFKVIQKKGLLIEDNGITESKINIIFSVFCKSFQEDIVVELYFKEGVIFGDYYTSDEYRYYTIKINSSKGKYEKDIDVDDDDELDLKTILNEIITYVDEDKSESRKVKSTKKKKVCCECGKVFTESRGTPVFRVIEKIPDWALVYMMYGDESGLDEEDVKLIDVWMKKNGLKILVGVEDDSYDEFSAHPAFGLPCATVTGIFQ